MPTGKPVPRHKLIGRYEVTAWLGSGASAAVYLGHDPALDAAVAIKVLADHHSSRPEIRERFIQEARILRRIANDRVVTVRDIGEIDGQPYFVMDAYAGGTLASRLEAQPQAPDVATLSHIINELSLCLAAVHDAGLIHRDIKPSNLLVRAAGGATPGPDTALAPTDQLVLGDFGIAREAELTALTQGIGTSGFMAPEQAEPLATIDKRVDIYAASALVQLIATGGASTSPQPSSSRLAAAIAAGMATDPSDRPPDALAWRDLMLSALAAPAVAAPAAVPTAPAPIAKPVAPAGMRSAPPIKTAAPQPRSRRTVVVAQAAVLAIIVGSVALWLTQAGGGPEIIGPDTIRVDDTATYSFEPVDGAAYLWVDSAGRTFTDESLTISPRSPGFLSLTLQETIAGTTESTTTRIEVVDE